MSLKKTIYNSLLERIKPFHQLTIHPEVKMENFVQEESMAEIPLEAILFYSLLFLLICIILIQLLYNFF